MDKDGKEEQRLQQALQLLGVRSTAPKHVRHNLVDSILTYAAVTRDKELERQCEVMLRAIKTEE